MKAFKVAMAIRPPKCHVTVVTVVDKEKQAAEGYPSQYVPLATALYYSCTAGGRI